jgi:large subunit ribosomal protein L29
VKRYGKKTKKVDVSGQTSEKLVEQITNSKKELFNLRCQGVMGELSDTSRFKKARRAVARAKTELTKRSRSK